MLPLTANPPRPIPARSPSVVAGTAQTMTAKANLPGARRPYLTPVVMRSPAGERLLKQSWFTNLVLILVIVFYGSLGRDVFFNHLTAATPENDPIGALLVYFRLFTCLVAVLAVISAIGFGPALASVPKLFLPYIAFALVSCLWADLVKDTFRSAVVLTALYLGMSLLFTRMGVVQIARLTMQVTAVVVIASALLAVLVPSIGRHSAADLLQGTAHAGRWRGIFSHKNGLGPWAAFGSVLFITHAQFLAGPRFYRWFAWACATACLMFAGSATSVLCAATLVLFHFIFRIREKVGGPAAVTALVTVTIFLTLLAFFASNILFGLLGRDATFTGRTTVWQFAWDYIQTSPWIGHGYQSLGGAEFLATEGAMLQQEIPGPEDMYLGTLLDLGTVGFVLFFVPVVVGLKRAISVLPRVVSADERSAITMMVIIVISALFMGITETTPFVCTGFDGVVCFTALFAILMVRPHVAHPPSPKRDPQGTFQSSVVSVPSKAQA